MRNAKRGLAFRIKQVYQAHGHRIVPFFWNRVFWSIWTCFSDAIDRFIIGPTTPGNRAQGLHTATTQLGESGPSELDTIGAEPLVLRLRYEENEGPARPFASGCRSIAGGVQQRCQRGAGVLPLQRAYPQTDGCCT